MNPNSVIILDEIEKAHKEVINTFLNIFDEGYLLDNKNRRIDFSNSIIIMTSNLGFSNNKTNVGFNNSPNNREDIDNSIKKYFKDELLNRVDEVIVFNHLTKDSYQKIARNYLFEISQDIDMPLDIEKMISNIDYNLKGVRELKRKLKSEIVKDNMEISL